MSIPAFILMAAFVGFAGFARESGISFTQTMVMSTLVWALPSLVVLVASMTSGASLIATAIAVALSAIRLFPMTISLMTVLRVKGKTPNWKLLVASHFVSVTAWVFAMQKLPELPQSARIPFFLGFGVALNVSVLLATAIAYQVTGQLPMIAAGSLFLLTPIYFLLTLWNAARFNMDKIALAIGLVCGPIFYIYSPGLDLILSGLIGGSLAFFLTRTKGWLK